MFTLLDFAANLEEEDGLGSSSQLPRRRHTGLNLRDSCANKMETCERGIGKKKSDRIWGKVGEGRGQEEESSFILKFHA